MSFSYHIEDYDLLDLLTDVDYEASFSDIKPLGEVISEKKRKLEELEKELHSLERKRIKKEISDSTELGSFWSKGFVTYEYLQNKYGKENVGITVVGSNDENEYAKEGCQYVYYKRKLDKLEHYGNKRAKQKKGKAKMVSKTKISYNFRQRVFQKTYFGDKGRYFAKENLSKEIDAYTYFLRGGKQYAPYVMPCIFTYVEGERFLVLELQTDDEGDEVQRVSFFTIEGDKVEEKIVRKERTGLMKRFQGSLVNPQDWDNLKNYMFLKGTKTLVRIDFDQANNDEILLKI